MDFQGCCDVKHFICIQITEKPRLEHVHTLKKNDLPRYTHSDDILNKYMSFKHTDENFSSVSGCQICLDFKHH